MEIYSKSVLNDRLRATLCFCLVPLKRGLDKRRVCGSVVI